MTRPASPSWSPHTWKRPDTRAFLHWRYAECPTLFGYLALRDGECAAMVTGFRRPYRFGREVVLRRIAEVLRPVLDRCVLISFDLPSIKILRMMTGARIGWVLDQYDDAELVRKKTAGK